MIASWSCTWEPRLRASGDTITRAAEDAAAKDGDVTFLFVGGVFAIPGSPRRSGVGSSMTWCCAAPRSQDTTPSVLAGAGCCAHLARRRIAGDHEPVQAAQRAGEQGARRCVGPVGTNVDEDDQAVHVRLLLRQGDADGLVDASVGSAMTELSATVLRRAERVPGMPYCDERTLPVRRVFEQVPEPRSLGSAPAERLTPSVWAARGRT